jgi:hypothetical protein
MPMFVLAGVPAAYAQSAGRDRCATLSEAERRKTEACKTAEEQAEDEYLQRQKEAEAREARRNTSFWKWMHVDGMWVSTAMGSTTFGVIGAHLAVANIGRIYLYGPPGVMLLLEPTGEGRRITPAWTYGVSILVTEFRMPGTDRTTQLFVNIAKTWTVGDHRNGMDMGGLSFTWKK